MPSKPLPPFSEVEQIIIEQIIEELLTVHRVPAAVSRANTGLIENDTDKTAPIGRQIVIGFFLPDGSSTAYKYLTPPGELDDQFRRYAVSSILETYSAYNNRG